jgi:hypothetical protein
VIRGAHALIVKRPQVNHHSGVIQIANIRNLRAISGQIVFETAPSNAGAPGAWTQLYAEAWNTGAVPLSSVLFELKGGTWRIEGSNPGTVIFDNFKAAKP